MNRNFAQTVFSGCVSGTAATALLSVEGFSGHLEQIDDFFSASLFLTFMGVSATVGALLITLAPVMRREAINAAERVFQEDRGRALSEIDLAERRAADVAMSGRHFLYAVYPCFLGFIALFGSDGFFDSIEITEGYAGSTRLLDVGAGFGDELIEAVAGTAFLGGSLFLFFKGMFGLRHL